MATLRKIEIAYPAIFTVDNEAGGYTVHFPDLEGCVTEGDTLEEARDMAREALSGYLESIFMRGVKIPEANSNATTTAGCEVHWIKPRLRISIPLALRRVRLEAGLTQQQVAHRLGMAYTSYQRFENPKDWNASVSKLEKVCRALDCELDVDIERILLESKDEVVYAETET